MAKNPEGMQSFLGDTNGHSSFAGTGGDAMFSQRGGSGGGSSNSGGASQPERSWPQSEFVKNVIEAPIDLANPGWRDKDIPNGRSIRLRAEAGMRDMDGTRSTSSFGPRDGAGMPSIIMPTGTAAQMSMAGPFVSGAYASHLSFSSSSTTASAGAATATGISRDGRKIIPSHLTHMKYKGIDPIDPEHRAAQARNTLQRDDPTLYSGTGSFGARTRRKSDVPPASEDDQRKRDMEHELANFPPILPSAMFASLNEDEIDPRRNALEDEVRMKWNIPARSTSPSSLRKSSNQRSSIVARKAPSGANEGEFMGARSYTSAVSLNNDAQLAAIIDPTHTRPSSNISSDVTFAAVKAYHPLIVSNHNTWKRILEHMLNHGVIVNPFNNITQFRLRSCFPPNTPTDMLASADTRRPQYPPNAELLRLANEVVMGTDWIKLTYENPSQALNALKSDGVFFDGFPLQVTPWDQADSSSSLDVAPVWLLPHPASGANNRDIQSLQPLSRKSPENFGASTTVKGRQLVLVHDESIFLKQPGFFEQLKLHMYDWLFQNTAQYDEEGNYIKGTGGWVLDLWHLFVV